MLWQVGSSSQAAAAASVAIQLVCVCANVVCCPVSLVTDEAVPEPSVETPWHRLCSYHPGFVALHLQHHHQDHLLLSQLQRGGGEWREYAAGVELAVSRL